MKTSLTRRDFVRTAAMGAAALSVTGHPEGFMAAYSSNLGNSGGSRTRFFCEKGQLVLDIGKA